MLSYVLLLLGLSIIIYSIYKKRMEFHELNLFKSKNKTSNTCSCNTNNEFASVYTRGGNRGTL